MEGGVFALFDLETHQQHPRAENQRRANIDLGHMRLRMAVDKKVEQHRLYSGDDAEESEKPAKEVVGHHIIEEIPKN